MFFDEDLYYAQLEAEAQDRIDTEDQELKERDPDSYSEKRAMGLL